jgi:hypothetical protein
MPRKVKVWLKPATMLCEPAGLPAIVALAMNPAIEMPDAR